MNMDILGSTFYSLLAMLVTLGILVTIHEYGHFITARWCGVKVERFSVGFGKPLLRWRGKPTPADLESGSEPTEYVISVLPLGGYVKMLGEQEAADPNPLLRSQSFAHKPLYQRAAIVAAGPLFNFLLAILLYWTLFLGGVSGLAPVIGEVTADSSSARAGLQAGEEILAVDGRPTPTWQDVRLALLERLGETGNIEFRLRNIDNDAQRQVAVPISSWLGDTDAPDLLGDLGLTPYHFVVEPRLEEVLPDSPAAAAGLQAGDLITASAGTEVRNWSAWLEIVRSHPRQAFTVEFLRDGLLYETELLPGVRLDDAGQPQLDVEGREQGYIGASVVIPELPAWMSRTQDYSLFGAAVEALRETWRNSSFVLDSMGKMLSGNISVKNLSGPITIAQVAGATASSGLEYFVGFLALLSISLAVLNLLPIPVLDGGHLFYYAVETLIRRPVPPRVQAIGMQVGMLLVGCIMLLALFNDVNRLF
jgi:regulator of sigma E protease